MTQSAAPFFYDVPNIRSRDDIGATLFIIKCSAALGLCAADVRDQCRERQRARSRHVIAWLVRGCFGLSYPAIGNLLGRDHRTIMNSVRVVGEALAQDAPWALNRIDAIRRAGLIARAA